MTILVGILCEDGAIVASDGMCSMNLGPTPFVGMSNTKTHIINNRIIAACAGNDNYMTLFVNFLRSNFAKLSQSHEENSSSDIQNLINELGAQFAHKLISTIKAYPPELVQSHLSNIQANGLEFEAILALPFKNHHYICHYDNRLNANLLRENGLWHAILGTGYLVATPSIHLVKKILNIRTTPKIDKGSVLAYWTVNHAIEVSSGGIGGDITTAILQKIDNQYTAAIENRVSEHKEIIDDMYKHIWSYESGKSSSEQIPKIPYLKE